MGKVSCCLLVAAVVLAVAACGDEPAAGPVEPASPSQPFIIDGLPADFVAVAAGTDGVDQDWATDWGSDSPFIVIQHGRRTVRIEAWRPEYEEQASESGQFPATGSVPDQWTFSGRLAGENIALRATSGDVEVPELDRLLDSVVPAGRRSAPTAEDLPNGWEVVGRSDADIVMSMGGRPGPPGAYGASWVRGDPNVDGTPRLTAVSLAGDAADISAWEGDLASPVNWFGDAHGEVTEVDGREAIFVLLDKWEGGPNHVLLGRMVDGSLLVLESSGNELLARDQLIALAASARPATDREWQALESQANQP